MASFIFIIAGLNLALGYLLALYINPQLQACFFPSMTASLIGPAASIEAPPIVPTLGTPIAESPADALLGAGDEPAAVANLAPVAPPTAASPAAKPADDPEPVGELIEEFKGELLNYREQLVAFDKRMRTENERTDAPDVATMQACLADLFQANARYLAQQEDSGVRLQRSCQAVEEHEPIGRQLGAALDSQAAQVRDATENLERIIPRDDGALGCQTIFNETARLLNASNTLRDTLDEVGLQLSGQGTNRDPEFADDVELAGKLVSRSLLEAALTDLWRVDPDRLQPLSLGLVDVDQCRELNDGRGVPTGDRVLATITRLVAASLQPRQLATRLGGEKFLLLLPGRTGRESTGTLEHIRQQVETIQFQTGADQFGISVSCAVVETVAGDAMEAILDRLESTLQEAKRCGHNRTFLHDGKFPTPVVPPILSLQPRTQEI